MIDVICNECFEALFTGERLQAPSTLNYLKWIFWILLVLTVLIIVVRIFVFK